jgi:oxamate amidohydrolase
MTVVAVAAPHPAAVEAAESAVAAGGGAIDAALAAAVALTVVYPHQCSAGGDLVALVHHPDGRVQAVLSIGAAAAAVDVVALRAAGDRMPGQGPHCVTVPGVVAGWEALVRLGGSSALLTRALTHAAGLAADGVPVSAGLARALADRKDAIHTDPGLRAVFAPGGELLAEGAALVQPALARTLRELARDTASYYSGPVADALAAGLRRLGSPLTAGDLAAHRAEYAEPLTLQVGEARWWAAPPPTQGAILLALLNAAPSVEHFRASAAARDRLLGDPRRGPVDLATLLHPWQTPVRETGAQPRASGDTVGITAMDDTGLAVTLIQSVYAWFGSGILEPETGLVLHSRGSAFSLTEGHPALIGPGLRPPHTLCPLIGRTDDVLLAVGCQGGRAQAQILAQTAPALLDPAASPDEVLARPRRVLGGRDLGFEGETLLAEPGAPTGDTPSSIPVAHAAGPSDDAGHVQTVRRIPGPVFQAAADPRADGRGAVLTTPSKEMTP